MLAKLSLTALKTKKRVVFYAIPSAKKVLKALGQSAGRIARMGSETMELSVLNPKHTVVVWVLLKNVKMITVRNGAYCGIQNVRQTFMPLHAVYAHPIALRT